MDKDSLNKMLRKDVKPGTESLAINEAQSQANSLLTERKLNLETEKQVSTSEYNRDTELKAAIELGSQNQPQQVQVNQQLAQKAANLRPETQEILAKYGITPTISESNRSNSNTTSTRTSNNKSQVIPDQSGGETRITNTTNVTNITNNNSKVETKVTTPPQAAQPVRTAPPTVVAAPVATAQSDNKFKTWLNGVFEKRRQEKALQDREYRRRDWEISRMTKRLTDRMSSISNSFAKRMNPENNGRTIMGQLKTILTMVGFAYLPKLWPKIISGIDTISNFVSEGFSSIKAAFSDDGNKEGGFFSRLGRSFVNLGGMIVNGISSSLGRMLGGDGNQTLSEVLAEKIQNAMGLESGLTFTESIKQAGQTLLDGVKEYVSLMLEERSDAIKSVWDKQDYSINPFSKKGMTQNFMNIGELLVAALGGWTGVSKIADSKMQREAAEKLTNSGLIDKATSLTSNILRLNLDDDGGIKSDLSPEESKVTMSAYMSKISELSTEKSSNNSDQITLGLHKMTEYDKIGRNYGDKGWSISDDSAKKISNEYSLNEDEAKTNYLAYKSLMTSNSQYLERYNDGYLVKQGGLLESILKTLTGGRFDPDRSYKDNQLILQDIRSNNTWNKTIDESKLPGFIKSAGFNSIFPVLGNAIDIYKGPEDYFKPTLSEAQQLADQANKGSKEYKEKRSEVKFTRKELARTSTNTSRNKKVNYQGPDVFTPPQQVKVTGANGQQTNVDAVTYATDRPVTTKTELRGNNPGNIRAVGSTGFERYSTLSDGYTAMFNKILRWYNKAPATQRVEELGLVDKKVDTINKLIRIWAPKQDKGNDEENYVGFVEKYTGINRDQIYNPNDEEQMLKIAEAMTIMEHLGGKSPTESMRSSMIEGWNNRGKSIVPITSTTNDIKYDALSVPLPDITASSSNISSSSNGLLNIAQDVIDGARGTVNNILEKLGLTEGSTKSEDSTDSAPEKVDLSGIEVPQINMDSFQVDKFLPEIGISKDEPDKESNLSLTPDTKSTPINVVNNGGSPVNNSNNVTNINISSNDPKMSFLDIKTRTYGR